MGFKRLLTNRLASGRGLRECACVWLGRWKDVFTAEESEGLGFFFKGGISALVHVISTPAVSPWSVRGVCLNQTSGFYTHRTHGLSITWS